MIRIISESDSVQNKESVLYVFGFLKDDEFYTMSSFTGVSYSDASKKAGQYADRLRLRFPDSTITFMSEDNPAWQKKYRRHVYNIDRDYGGR